MNEKPPLVQEWLDAFNQELAELPAAERATVIKRATEEMIRHSEGLLGSGQGSGADMEILEMELRRIRPLLAALERHISESEQMA